MQIIQKNIAELVPYDNNPRNNEGAVEYVANSIKEFGFKNPVIIDKDNVIVAGHTRLLAAKSLGMKEVPCIIASDLTPEQVKAFRLADNKVSEMADWEWEKLQQELDDLGNADWDMGNFGFDVTLSADDKDFQSFFEPAPVPPPPVEPSTKRHDDDTASDPVDVTYEPQGREEFNDTENTEYVICPHCGQRIDL